MKVIFLDIDGVIKTKNGLRSAFKKYRKLVPDILDERAVTNLNKLVKETDAKIVITSTWRYGKTTEALQRVLAINGVIGEVIGMTPELGQMKNSSIDTITRGQEIQEWLNLHKIQVDYVILDDDTNLLPQQMNYFVRCESEDGFADENKYREALAILK
jgi:hypothetical protein